MKLAASAYDIFSAVKAIPIESVVRGYYPGLDLKPAGRDLLSNCPLHDETTPSFHVYTEKNSWHCFGACAKGGSAVDLLLAGDLASNPLDAAKSIAQKFEIDSGIQKPKRKSNNLTVAQYADFCALDTEFLIETFSLSHGESGVEIPYKNESGEIISVQRRHGLEKTGKKDGRFSWRKGDKVLPYGLWLPKLRDATRLIVVEGASDVHVLTHCGAAALGIPGAGNFKHEMALSLVPFAEVILIQEPGAPGEQFITSITAALKAADYKGTVRAVTLPAKDPRELWLSCKDQKQFTDKLEEAVANTKPIELYPAIPRAADLIFQIEAPPRRNQPISG
jgi:DNA primase